MINTAVNEHRIKATIGLWQGLKLEKKKKKQKKGEKEEERKLCRIGSVAVPVERHG